VIGHLQAALLVPLVGDREVGTDRLRRVLIVLCDHANRAGLSWPSVATICREAGIDSRRRVQHALVLLEEQFVISGPRTKLGGRGKPSTYLLLFEPLAERGGPLVMFEAAESARQARAVSERERARVKGSVRPTERARTYRARSNEALEASGSAAADAPGDDVAGRAPPRRSPKGDHEQQQQRESPNGQDEPRAITELLGRVLPERAAPKGRR
jgi:hypothetical protein